MNPSHQGLISWPRILNHSLANWKATCQRQIKGQLQPHPPPLRIVVYSIVHGTITIFLNLVSEVASVPSMQGEVSPGELAQRQIGQSNGIQRADCRGEEYYWSRYRASA